MSFLRRLIGGGEPDGDAVEGAAPAGPHGAPGGPRDASDVSDAEASRAEPTPGLLGDLPWVPAARVASSAAVLSPALLAALLGTDEARLHAWIAETEPVPEPQLARLAFVEELAGRLAAATTSWRFAAGSSGRGPSSGGVRRVRRCRGTGRPTTSRSCRRSWH